MKNIKTVLTTLVLGLATQVSSAAELNILPPSGLRECRSSDPMLSVIQKIAVSQSAEYLGCYLSDQRAELHGENKGASHLLTYAYALKISPEGQTSEHLDALYQTTLGQWKDFKPLTSDKREYERKIADLAAKALPDHFPKMEISLAAPVLVTIEQLADNAYLVISIRQRKVSLNNQTYISTSIDGSSILLKNGVFVRMSLVRELQSKTDITVVDEGLRNWVRSEIQR
jgi:hypothetical protein